jgi:hypothetical protein
MKNGLGKESVKGFRGYEEKNAREWITLPTSFLDGDKNATSTLHLHIGNAQEGVVLDGLYHDFWNSKCTQSLNDDEVTYLSKAFFMSKPVLRMRIRIREDPSLFC